MDLSKADFFQFKNSLKGWLMTLGCHGQQLTHSHKEVTCNICGWQGYRFYPHVTKARVAADEKCPRCHSIPRYRLIQHFLVHELDFYNQCLSVLEVGPNRSLQTLLTKSDKSGLYQHRSLLTPGHGPYGCDRS